MNVHLPAPRRRWAARLVNLAAVVVVLALAAATFVLSYSGVHVIALQAGVSTRLARLYPATFDAVLVIACLAAVTLRDARWWIRCYAWLTIILMVGVVGAADAVHAMNVALPHRKMEGVVAAAPWVLVLLGFSLMLTILRYSRAQHAAHREPAALDAFPAPASAVPSIALPPAPSALAGPLIGEAAPPIEEVTEQEEESTSAARSPALYPAPTTPVPTTPAPTIPVPTSQAAAGPGAWRPWHERAAEPSATDEPRATDEPCATAEPGATDEPRVTVEPHATDEADAAAEAPATDAVEPDESEPASGGEADADYWDAVPRLNRVRATPTPPGEEDGEE